MKKSRVLVVGAGGLGCPALIYLAGAGVGTIGLVDGDIVEESNLARQILHTTARVGNNKALSAIDSAKAYVQSCVIVVNLDKDYSYLSFLQAQSTCPISCAHRASNSRDSSGNSGTI